MDKITALSQRNPAAIARQVGHRLRELRLARGWTQEEVAERAGVAVSTLKLLEAKGQGAFLRLVKVAVVLGVDGAVRELFAGDGAAESIEAVKLSERKRAPRRRKEGEGGA